MADQIKEVVIIAGCVDPRVHKFLDELAERARQSGRECVVLRNPGANFKALRHSINNAHMLGKVVEIDVSTHGDCAAVRYAGEVLDGKRDTSQDIEQGFVSLFRSVDAGAEDRDAENRKIQLTLGETYVWHATKDEYVGKERLPPKSANHSIVAIIEPYSGTYGEIADALQVDAAGMYTIQVLSRGNEPSKDLELAAKMTCALVPEEVLLVRLSENDALYNAAEKMIKEAVPGAKVRQVPLRNREKQKI